MNKHMANKNALTRADSNQRGIVSIVVTIIIMIVLTLIVLSFAKISRREQRSALDRQLSAQAFYAAESGINDARKVIESWVASGSVNLNTDYMDDCTTFASPARANLPLPGVLAGSGAASYTCLFVDPSPERIVFSKSDEQHVFPIKDKDSDPITDIEVYWDDGSGGGSFATCPTPPANPTTLPAGCNAPLLRIELVDATSDSTLANSSKSFFIYPGTSGSSVSYGGSASGTAVQTTCNAATVPNKCKIIINGLGATAGYFMRVKGIYGAAAITVTANTETAELVGAQALIDATGKATDVERRIQVRVKANNLGGDIPLYGLEGTDKICKKFSIDGTNAIDNGSCSTGVFPD